MMSSGAYRLPSVLKRSLRRALAKGFTARELARLYGLPLAAVKEAMDVETAQRRHRERTSRRRESRAAWVTEVRALRASGWSLPALGKRFGRSKSTLSLVCRGIASPIEPAWSDDGPEICPSVLSTPPAIRDDAVSAPEVPLADSSPSLAAASTAWGNYHDRPAIGSAHGRSKLTESEAAELRAFRASDPKRWTYPALAEHFGISRSNVFYVLSGRTWSHVPMAEDARASGAR